MGDEIDIDDSTAKVLAALADVGEDNVFELARIAQIDPEKFRLFLAEYGQTKNPHAQELLKAAESLRSKQRETQATTRSRKKKKLTLMFFFASDNTLSPSTLSQVKAIKAAGSQVDTNVLVYFGPNEGAPTRVLEINKGQAPAIASDFGAPDISVLLNDYVNSGEIGDRRFRDELTAAAALQHFLRFCGEAYPAEHYMLFLVGHGPVVGRDAFLPDDNPDSAIGLISLGRILKDFKHQVDGGALEFIGMHGCSMSAVEVAYELKGTARYMLASQSPSFIGSWPYGHLLTKIYHDVGNGVLNVSALVKSLHTLCIQYSVDFMHAGYSSDLCLCSLDRVDALTAPISRLSQVLQSGLAEPHVRDKVVLAHWQSQGYWQESYSDLYDFCLCLSRLCQEPGIEQSAEWRAHAKRSSDLKMLEIIEACAGVMNTIKPENGHQDKSLVVCADYVGPDAQYSHGLSIYFPWSQPLEDDNDHVIRNYENYAFTSSIGHQTWLQFLDAYFMSTKRFDRVTEEAMANGHSRFNDLEFRQWLEAAREAFPGEMAVGSRDFVPTSVLEGKITPPASGVGACTCTSTKNYSRVFSMSPGAWGQYSTKVEQRNNRFLEEGNVD